MRTASGVLGAIPWELGLLDPVLASAPASAFSAICLPSLPLSIGSKSPLSFQKQYIYYFFHESLLDSDSLPEIIPFFEFSCWCVCTSLLGFLPRPCMTIQRRHSTVAESMDSGTDSLGPEADSIIYQLYGDISFLTSMCLSFLLCKMEITIVPSLQA